MIATLYRLISLGLLIRLRSQLVPGSAACLCKARSFRAIPSRPSQPMLTPPTGGSSTNKYHLPTPTKAPAATPFRLRSGSPSGMQPASLPQSVLVYTWNERQQRTACSA